MSFGGDAGQTFVYDVQINVAGRDDIEAATNALDNLTTAQRINAESEREIRVEREANLRQSLQAQAATKKAAFTAAASDLKQAFDDQLAAKRSAAAAQAAIDRQAAADKIAAAAHYRAYAKAEDAEIREMVAEQDRIKREALKRQDVAIRSVTEANRKGTDAFGQSSQQMAAWTRTIYFASQGVEDLQYGFSAAVNNIPLVTMSFAQAVGASTTAAMGWAAALSVVAVSMNSVVIPAVQRFIDKSPGVKEAMRSLNESLNPFYVHEFKSALETLEERIKELQGKKVKLAVDSDELETASEQAKKMKDDLKEAERLLNKVTPGQQEQGKHIGEHLDYMLPGGVAEVTEKFVDKFATEGYENHKDKPALDARSAKNEKRRAYWISQGMYDETFQEQYEAEVSAVLNERNKLRLDSKEQAKVTAGDVIGGAMKGKAGPMDKFYKTAAALGLPDISKEVNAEAKESEPLPKKARIKKEKLDKKVSEFWEQFEKDIDDQIDDAEKAKEAVFNAGLKAKGDQARIVAQEFRQDLKGVALRHVMSDLAAGKGFDAAGSGLRPDILRRMGEVGVHGDEANAGADDLVFGFVNKARAMLAAGEGTIPARAKAQIGIMDDKEKKAADREAKAGIREMNDAAKALHDADIKSASDWFVRNHRGATPGMGKIYAEAGSKSLELDGSTRNAELAGNAAVAQHIQGRNDRVAKGFRNEQVQGFANEFQRTHPDATPAMSQKVGHMMQANMEQTGNFEASLLMLNAQILNMLDQRQRVQNAHGNVLRQQQRQVQRMGLNPGFGGGGGG